MSEMFDAKKACAVCGYPVPEHSVLCSAERPEPVEMCPCGDMSDRECREANRKAAEASGSVCCARFRDSANTHTPPRGTGEDAMVEADAALVDVAQGIKALYDERQAIFLALNPECPAFPGVPNTCNESVCDCFAADDLAGQITALRARLAAAERAGAERAAGVCDEAVVECRRAAQRAQEQGNLELMCSREDKADCAEALASRIRALFPPPGAEVGRG